MDTGTKEYRLTLKAKMIMGGVLLLFGGPMLYAARLQFSSQQPLMGTLMVVLFVLFVLVLLIATGHCIRITDNSLQRESLFGQTEIAFEEVDTLHLGSSWTNFHIATDGTKVFITSDFKHHYNIIRRVVQRINRAQSLDSINMTGDQQSINRYLAD